MKRKLVSGRGTLLGTVVYPSHWEIFLHREGSVRFHIMPKFKSYAFSERPMTQNITLEMGVLSVCHYGEFPDAVTLHGINLEQFEQIPDCHFYPSAAYIRSVLG